MMNSQWSELELLAMKELQEEEKRERIDNIKKEMKAKRALSQQERKIAFKIFGYEVSFTYKRGKK